MKTCDDCGGQGGEEVSRPGAKWGADPYGGEWIECPACRGSGWIEGEPEQLGLDDLDERCGSLDGVRDV